MPTKVHLNYPVAQKHQRLQSFTIRAVFRRPNYGIESKQLRRQATATPLRKGWRCSAVSFSGWLMDCVVTLWEWDNEESNALCVPVSVSGFISLGFNDQSPGFQIDAVKPNQCKLKVPCFLHFLPVHHRDMAIWHANISNWSRCQSGHPFYLTLKIITYYYVAAKREEFDYICIKSWIVWTSHLKSTVHPKKWKFSFLASELNLRIKSI